MNETNKKTAVIWAKDLPSKKLFAKDQYLIIDNFEQFQKQSFDEFEVVIILAELNWGHNRLSQLFGLEVLKMLRFQKSSVVRVILASFLELQQIKRYNSNEPIEISEASFVRLPQIHFTTSGIKAPTEYYNSLFKYFFEINHYWNDFDDHGENIIRDISEQRVYLAEDELEIERMQKLHYIYSRIDFLLKCHVKMLESSSNPILDNAEGRRLFGILSDRTPKGLLSLQRAFEELNTLIIKTL